MTLVDGKRGRLGPCNGPHCGAIVVWVFNPKTGRTSPYDVQPDPKHPERALSHFVTCPDAERFRRPRGAEWA